MPPPRKLLDQVRDILRTKQYSPRTEESYLGWIRRYILFHQKRHPDQMGAPEVTAFLSYLAIQEHVAPSTQNQALSAILFLYRHVLRKGRQSSSPTKKRQPSRDKITLTADAH